MNFEAAGGHPGAHLRELAAADQARCPVDLGWPSGGARGGPRALPAACYDFLVIVEKSRHQGRTLLRVEGVIKLGESGQFFAQTLDRVLERDEGDVLIDLSKIDAIDSTGIGELVGYLGRFRSRGRGLLLINPSDRIRKLLAIANLTSLLPVFETVDDALAARP